MYKAARDEREICLRKYTSALSSVVRLLVSAAEYEKQQVTACSVLCSIVDFVNLEISKRCLVSNARLAMRVVLQMGVASSV